MIEVGKARTANSSEGEAVGALSMKRTMAEDKHA